MFGSLQCWMFEIEIWDAQDAGCLACGMFKMWVTLNVAKFPHLEQPTSRTFHMWDVGYLGWWMFGMRNVGYVGYCVC